MEPDKNKLKCKK